MSENISEIFQRKKEIVPTIFVEAIKLTNEKLNEDNTMDFSSLFKNRKRYEREYKEAKNILAFTINEIAKTLEKELREAFNYTFNESE